MNTDTIEPTITENSDETVITIDKIIPYGETGEETTRERINLIFHWGLYSVPGYDDINSARRRKIKNGSEWYLKRLSQDPDGFRPISGHVETKKYHQQHYGNTSYSDFIQQFAEGDIEKNMRQWMIMARDAHVHTVILTTKHHDGVTLWDCKDTDLVDLFTTLARQYGLRVGFYYSWLEFSQSITIKFIVNVIVPQIKKLVTYHPDLFWFDGQWGIKSACAQRLINIVIEDFIKKPLPYIEINDRICPVNTARRDGLFTFYSHERDYSDAEVCDGKQHEIIDTIGLSWGYNRDQQDRDYKTAEQLYSAIKSAWDKNSYITLNFGPKADGSLDPREVDVFAQCVSTYLDP